MSSQSRRTASSKMTRRQRRAQGTTQADNAPSRGGATRTYNTPPREGAARTYNTPASGGAARTYSLPSRSSASVRRSYLAEPQAVDYTAEARSIRKDLLRLVFWASLLIVAMIVLSFLPLPIG